MKKEKAFRKITMGFFSLMALGLFTTVTSCDDDDKYYDITHKVVYKAEGSAGVNITTASYNVPGSNPKPATNVSGTTWTSPEVTGTLTLREGRSGIMGALVNVQATGTNASSTLKVQIYVDGVLKNEVTTTGQNLETLAQYNVEYKAN